MLCLSVVGIAVCVGMASTFAYANSTFRHQVSLRVNDYIYLHRLNETKCKKQKTDVLSVGENIKY